jgi:hypothetical protein
MVMMFEKFILNNDFFKNLSKTFNQRSFNFDFFQKVKIVVKKKVKSIII